MTAPRLSDVRRRARVLGDARRRARTIFVVRAVDADGHFGAAFTRPLDVTRDGAPDRAASSSRSRGTTRPISISTSSIRTASRSSSATSTRTSRRRRASPPEPPSTPHRAAILDFDSNAQCVPDGRHAENVVWHDKPPSGHYIVRVDTFSLCGEAGAHWRVEGFLDGVSIGAAEGSSTEYDTRFAHDRGAGVLALELDVP